MLLLYVPDACASSLEPSCAGTRTRTCTTRRTSSRSSIPVCEQSRQSGQWRSMQCNCSVHRCSHVLQATYANMFTLPLCRGEPRRVHVPLECARPRAAGRRALHVRPPLRCARAPPAAQPLAFIYIYIYIYIYISLL